MGDPHDQIARIAAFTTETLFSMGATDLAAAAQLAQRFAPVAYRSLASQMKNDPPAVPVNEECQQVLEWEHADAR